MEKLRKFELISAEEARNISLSPKEDEINLQIEALNRKIKSTALMGYLGYCWVIDIDFDEQIFKQLKKMLEDAGYLVINPFGTYWNIIW